MQLVKMMFCWGKVGPESSVRGALMRREKTQTHARRKAGDAGAETGAPLPGNAEDQQCYQKLETAREGPTEPAVCGVWPGPRSQISSLQNIREKSFLLP